MDIPVLNEELRALLEEYGPYPYEFFNILTTTENDNLCLESQNAQWSELKRESWHSLNLESYNLWAISDNGDLLWWNGEQTIAMNPRDQEFMSLHVNPKQFIRLIGMGKVTGIFPNDLWSENA